MNQKFTVAPIPKAPIINRPPSAIVGYNPAKVSQVSISGGDNRKYYGSLTQYHGWKVIIATPRPGGRVDLTVTRGVKVAEIKSARASSIIG